MKLVLRIVCQVCIVLLLPRHLTMALCAKSADSTASNLTWGKEPGSSSLGVECPSEGLKTKARARVAERVARQGWMSCYRPHTCSDWAEAHAAD